MDNRLAYYEDCMVQIFNRYGQKVYDSRGYSKPRDGSLNGSPLPTGSYVWQIQLKKTGSRYPVRAKQKYSPFLEEQGESKQVTIIPEGKNGKVSFTSCG